MLPHATLIRHDRQIGEGHRLCSARWWQRELRRLAFGFDAFRREKRTKFLARVPGPTPPAPRSAEGVPSSSTSPPHAYTQTTFSNLTIFFLKKFEDLVSNIMTD